MSNSALNMSALNPPPLQDNIANNSIIDRDFALPKSLYPHLPLHANQLSVPPSSMTANGALHGAFQDLNMTSKENEENGEQNGHHTPSDTPPLSASSTAPGSPRM